VQPDPQAPQNQLLAFANAAQTHRSASTRQSTKFAKSRNSSQPRQKSKAAEQWQEEDQAEQWQNAPKGNRAADQRLHVDEARRSARSRRQNGADRRDAWQEDHEEAWQDDWEEDRGATKADKWQEDHETHGGEHREHREHRVQWQNDYDRHSESYESHSSTRTDQRQNDDEFHSAPKRQSKKATKARGKREKPRMVVQHHHLPRAEVQRLPSPGWRPWVYLASGLGFSSQQYDRVLPKLVAAIEAAGAQVYEPFTDNPEVNKPAKEQTPGWAYRIGQADIDAVRRCDGLFCWANMNPPDEGAMVELGVAIGLRKKVFLYRDDFRTCAAVEDYPLNLMLFSGMPERGWQDYYYACTSDIADPQKAFRRWCDGDRTV